MTSMLSSSLLLVFSFPTPLPFHPCSPSDSEPDARPHHHRPVYPQYHSPFNCHHPCHLHPLRCSCYCRFHSRAWNRGFDRRHYRFDPPGLYQLRRRTLGNTTTTAKNTAKLLITQRSLRAAPSSRTTPALVLSHRARLNENVLLHPL